MEHVIHIRLEPGTVQNSIPLPHTFTRAQTENLYVSLQSAAFKISQTPPGIGKIRLLELDGFNSNLVQDKILDVFRIEKSTVYKDRRVQDFVKLSHHTLASLTFEILNGEDRPIKLAKPGYLTLRIKAMDKDYSSFSLHVTEEGKRKISGFRYQLPYPIHLEQVGHWKIGLSSVIFPNPNIGKDRELRITADLGNKSMSWTYADSKISSIRKFIGSLQLDVIAKLELQESQSFRVGVLDDKKFALVSSEPIQLMFSNRMAYLLGFVDEGYTKAGRSITLTPNLIFTAPNHVDLSRDVTEAVYIRCAQISTSIVNKSFDHIMKLIPVQSKNDKYFYYESEDVEFHSILPTTLSHLDITLLDQHFLPLPYKSTRFDKIFMSLKIVHDK